MSETENTESNRGGEFMPLQADEGTDMQAKNLEATHQESGPVGGETFLSYQNQDNAMADSGQKDFNTGRSEGSEGVLPQQDNSAGSGFGSSDERREDTSGGSGFGSSDDRPQESQSEQRDEQQDRRDDQQQERRDDDNNEGGDNDKPDRKSKPGASRENPDAIPTAGGEQLGKKHWGESKIVPDVPKTGGDEKVSSSEGQPDQQTQDNTAKNSGGNTGGEGEAPKAGFVDKVKDKLGVGKKE